MYKENRSKATIVLLALAICALSALIATRDRQQPSSHTSSAIMQTVQAQTAKQNGLSYAEYAIDEYKPVVMNRMLEELKETGANWVALVVTRYQYAQNSTVIYPTVKTATDDDLIYAIDRAHQLGLKVTLKPHVDIESDSSIWRGRIGQNFDSAHWVAWFSSYTTFIDHYATLANDHNVDQFVVGTELAGTSQRETEWRAVISDVRSLYPNGSLTYSANHSGEETAINWWDAVDFIGISAYYPLTTNAAASLADLESGWQSIAATLSSLSTRTGKTILFTEVGFRSTDGSAIQPWCSGCAGSLDASEQANAYQAFYNVIYTQPWFVGMYWWGWDVDPADSGPCDGDYSPFNKPAENVIRQAHGATLKNIPSDCNNLPPTATPISINPTATPPAPQTNSNPGFVLVDNFNAVDSGLLDGQNGWTTLGNTSIAADPLNGTNQAMRLQGENVIAQHHLPFRIDDNSIATIHYRVLREGEVDSGTGATDERFPTTFDAFEPQFGVALGQVDAFYARDGNGFKTLDGTFLEDSWFCVWLVVDMANNSSEIYSKGGNFADVTQLDAQGQSTFQFRNGDADLLRTFYTRTGWDGGGAIFFDDIYLDTTGKNLASPVSSCQSPTMTATPVDTATATPVDTATATPVDTATPIPADTATPIPVNTATSVPADTATPLPVDTATPLPADTATSIPADTATSIPVDTATSIPADTATSIPVDTATSIPADTATSIPADTATSIPMDTATSIPADTATSIPADIATQTPADTKTPIALDTATPIPVDTATPTVDDVPMPTSVSVATAISIVRPTSAPPSGTDRSELYLPLFDSP